MPIFLRAVIWNSYFFLFWMSLIWILPHWIFFGRIDIWIPVSLVVLISLLLSTLFAFLHFKLFGITTIRFKNGKSKKFLGINYVKKISLPVKSDKAVELIKRMNTLAEDENIVIEEINSNELLFLTWKATSIITFFKLTAIDDTTTEIELSTRLELYRFYPVPNWDFHACRDFTELLIENLSKVSQGKVVEKQHQEKKLEKITIAISQFSVIFSVVFVAFMFLFNTSFFDHSIYEMYIESGDVGYHIRKFTDKPYGRLTESDCAEITDLNLRFRCIDSLEGIELCTNLKTLNLSENEIEDLSPLANLIHLEEINLTENKIIDISPLENMNNLKILDVSENKIIDISVLAGLTTLETLDLDYNQITDFTSLKNHTDIKFLEISGYKFGNFDPVISLSNLEHLSYAGNAVSNLAPLVQLNNLQSVVLNNNEIVDFSALNRMENLKTASLKGNKITDISPVLETKYIENLDLSKNEINDLSPLIECDKFRSNLFLVVRGNVLTLESTFSYLPTLKERGLNIRY